MKKYFILALPILICIILSCENEEDKGIPTKFEICQMCLDSCNTAINKKAVNGRYSLTHFSYYDNIEVIANGKTYNEQVNEADTMQNLRARFYQSKARSFFIRIDTIYEGIILTYSEKTPIEIRNDYPVSQEVKNKISLSVNAYIPNPVQKKVDTLKHSEIRQEILNCKVIKNLQTGKVESIRVYIDSTEYILDESHLRK